MRRSLFTALVTLLLASSLVAAPVAGIAAAQQDNGTDATPTPTGDNESVAVGSDQPEEKSDTGPKMAESVRISPVSFSKEYARIETIEEDKEFNVTGTYAVFASNIDVQTARVNQPGGDARVMDGNRAIEVEFEEDAAPGTSSYFEVELFFEDGSSYTLDLNVQNTDLQVSTVDMREASALAERIKSDARDAGYDIDERGIAAAEEYYVDTKHTAELLSNIFGPALKDLQMALIAAGASALFIILLMAGAIFFIRRLKKGHEWKLEALVNTPNLSDIKRQAMSLARIRDRQEAAEHPLSEVPEIGRDYVYWADQYGVYTVKQLADLFHFGQVRFENGEIVRDDDGRPVMEHEGIDQLLDADRIRDTWLEPAIRDGMLSEQDAIAHGKTALDLMSSKFNEPGYRPSRMRTRELLDDLNEGRAYSFGSGNTGTGGRHSYATGADD